jgi:hypothetical protein
MQQMYFSMIYHLMPSPFALIPIQHFFAFVVLQQISVHHPLELLQ